MDGPGNRERQGEARSECARHIDAPFPAAAHRVAGGGQREGDKRQRQEDPRQGRFGQVESPTLRINRHPHRGAGVRDTRAVSQQHVGGRPSAPLIGDRADNRGRMVLEDTGQFLGCGSGDRPRGRVGRGGKGLAVGQDDNLARRPAAAEIEGTDARVHALQRRQLRSEVWVSRAAPIGTGARGFAKVSEVHRLGRQPDQAKQVGAHLAVDPAGHPPRQSCAGHDDGRHQNPPAPVHCVRRHNLDDLHDRSATMSSRTKRVCAPTGGR